MLAFVGQLAWVGYKNLASSEEPDRLASNGKLRTRKNRRPTHDNNFHGARLVRKRTKPFDQARLAKRKLASWASHSGSNLGSNIAHPKKKLLIWHGVNEERDACGNIICYCNITHPEVK